MTRSVLACLTAAALVAGCVTVTPPTAPPSGTPAPSAAVTPAPTVPPTAAPTVAPTAAATAEPTAPPTAGPTAEPTAQPTGLPADFDARDLLFRDDLSDPTGVCAGATGTTPLGCFGIGDVTSSDGQSIGSVNYANGLLSFGVDVPTGWIWTRRVVEGEHSTMRVAAEFIPTSEGRFGLFCQSGDNPAQLWGAVIGTDGSWVLGDIGQEGVNALAEDPAGGLFVPIGEKVAMAVECTGLSTGALRLTLWAINSGPVATYETEDGPDNFDRAAVYVQATDVAASVDVDLVGAFGSGYGDGQMTDAALELLSHVPEDWHDNCYQSLRPPFLGSIAEVLLTCFIREPGDDGAEIVEYAAYLTTEEMNDAYQARVYLFGAGEAASCGDGSSEHDWWLGEDRENTIGRILCTDQFRGIRFDWTDERLNILGTLVDFDGDYELTLGDWEVAGPNP
jgi:hypothetical protein